MTRIRKMNPIEPMNDHDLIITIHEQIKNVRSDIKDLKDGTEEKLADHEARLRRLELWCSIAIGFMYAIQFYINFLHK